MHLVVTIQYFQLHVGTNVEMRLTSLPSKHVSQVQTIQLKLRLISWNGFCTFTRFPGLVLLKIRLERKVRSVSSFSPMTRAYSSSYVQSLHWLIRIQTQTLIHIQLFQQQLVLFLITKSLV